MSLVQLTEVPMPNPVTISAARQGLFGLFESVTGHKGRKIVIANRGAEARAVLVGESYLNSLEQAAKRLKDIESGKAAPKPRFKLIGSMKFTRDSEEMLTEIRSEQKTLWEKKLASFSEQ
jgi:hypothetical protein